MDLNNNFLIMKNQIIILILMTMFLSHNLICQEKNEVNFDDINTQSPIKMGTLEEANKKLAEDDAKRGNALRIGTQSSFNPSFDEQFVQKAESITIEEEISNKSLQSKIQNKEFGIEGQNNNDRQCSSKFPLYKAKATVYFYTDKSISSPIQGKIYKNDKLFVLDGSSNLWWFICFEGKRGWIAKEQIEFFDKDKENAKLLDILTDIKSKEYFLIYIILFGVLSFLLAFFIGKYRMIGFWFSFVLGILLTPFVSWLPIILSRKKSNFEEFTKTKKILRKMLGVILIIGALFGLLFNANAPKDNFQPYFIAFGLIAYGIYLLK
jgi:hypothetical protein